MFSTSHTKNRVQTAASSTPEHRVPVYSPDEQAEFDAVVTLLQKLQPWQRAALQDVCDMIDRGIIKEYPTNVMVRDIRRVIASHRAMHEISGAK